MSRMRANCRIFYLGRKKMLGMQCSCVSLLRNNERGSFSVFVGYQINKLFRSFRILQNQSREARNYGPVSIWISNCIF